MTTLKKAVLALCGSFYILCLCSCGRGEAPAAESDITVSYHDLSGVLQAVTLQTANHRFVEEAENGRIIEYDLTFFYRENISTFAEWLRQEQGRESDILVVETGEEEVLSEDEARKLIPETADAGWYFQWIRYTITVLEYDPKKPDRYTMEVNVVYPADPDMGGGIEYVLEKTDGNWTVIDEQVIWTA